MKSSSRFIKYLLICGVLLVWSLIIFRVVMGPGSVKTILITTQTIGYVNRTTTNDTFSILANYPDPFISIGDTLSEELSAKTNFQPTAIPRKLDSSIKQLDYGFIKYIGLISGGTKKVKIAMLDFKGEQVLLKKYDEYEGFELLSIYVNKIFLIKNGKKIQVNLSK
jgi:hypothetical protein